MKKRRKNEKKTADSRTKTSILSQNGSFLENRGHTPPPPPGFSRVRGQNHPFLTLKFTHLHEMCFRIALDDEGAIFVEKSRNFRKFPKFPDFFKFSGNFPKISEIFQNCQFFSKFVNFLSKMSKIRGRPQN